MAGTHYTLDRDKVENQNPMDLVKEKPCRTCSTVKPNDFKNFGKKLWKTRYDLTTNDVCIACQKAKVSATMKNHWKSRKHADDVYHAEQLRMARTIYEANELARKQAVEAEAEANAWVKPISQPFGSVRPTADDSDGSIRPISIGEAMGLDRKL